MKNFIKNEKIKTVVFALAGLIWLIFVYVEFVSVHSSYKEYSVDNLSTSYVILDEENLIEQTVHSEYPLTSFDLKVGTFFETISSGNLHITVCDNDGEILYTDDYSLIGVVDNSYFSMEFKNPVYSADGNYTIRIWSSGLNDQMIAAYLADSDDKTKNAVNVAWKNSWVADPVSYEMIEEGEVVDQIINFNYQLSSYSIKLGTFYETLSGGYIHLSIRDNNGEILYTDEYSLSGVEDNSVFTMNFNDSVFSSDGIYRVELSFSDIDEQKIALYITDPEKNELIITDSELPGTLKYSYTYLRTGYQYPMYFLLCVVPFTIAVCIFIFSCKKNIEPEIAFIPICLFLAVSYLFVSPPYYDFDEIHHSSEISFYASKIMGRYAETDTDTNVLLFERRNVESYKYMYEFSAESNELVVEKLISGFQDYDTGIWEQDKDQNTACIYVYIPQIIGQLVARLFGLNALFTILCEGLFGIVFYIFVMYQIIRRSSLKHFFFLIGLLPYSLNAAGSTSYDIFFVEMGSCTLAIWLELLINTKTCKKRTLILWGICFSLLCSVRLIYFPLILLLLLLPDAKVKKIEKTCVCIFAFVITALLVSLNHPGVVSYGLASGNAITPWGEKTFSLFRWITDYPIHTIRILFESTFYDSIRSIVYAPTIFQFQTIPLVVGIGLVVIIVFVLQNDMKASCYIERNKALLFCSFIYASCVLLGSVVAISWTSTSKLLIYGNQMRYYLPILPLAYLAIANCPFMLNDGSRMKNNRLIACGIGLNVISILYLLETMLQ